MNDPQESCANCGAALQGPFCAKCGQSREAIKRPFLALIKDALDGALDWDGRLLTTVRALFLKPGLVGREYVEGHRARYTPPVRMYLSVSLIFFLAMAALDFRVIAIQLTDIPREIVEQAQSPALDELNEIGVDQSITITLFQKGDPPDPIDLTPEEWARAESILGSRGRLTQLSLEMLRSPAEFEARVSAGAAQALFIMLAGFALINVLLHTRCRLIEHVVYSLYYHAAFLLIGGVILTIAAFVSNGWILTGLTVVMLAAYLLLTGAYDRSFYGSSWIGVILRVPVIMALYAMLLLGALLAAVLIAYA